MKSFKCIIVNLHVFVDSRVFYAGKALSGVDIGGLAHAQPGIDDVPLFRNLNSVQVHFADFVSADEKVF